MLLGKLEQFYLKTCIHLCDLGGYYNLSQVTKSVSKWGQIAPFIGVILANTSSRVIIYYIHLDHARTVTSLKLSNTRINENYLCVPTFSI